MSTLPPDTSKQRPAAAPQKPDDALSHQERVYFEMFRAIEQLGRKLEKADAERYMLSRRLSDIESSAEKDEATGRYYLPAKLEPVLASAPQGLSGAAKGSIAASLVFALLALGAVVTQDMPQKSGAQQIAAIDALLKQGGETLAARGVWHQRTADAPQAVSADTPQTISTDTPQTAAAAETAPTDLAQADLAAADVITPDVAAAEIEPAAADAAAVIADAPAFTVVAPPVQLVQAEQPPALTGDLIEQTSYLREAVAAAPPQSAHEEETEDFNEHLAEALDDLHGDVAEAAPIDATEEVMAEVAAEAGDAYTVEAEPAVPGVAEVTEVADANVAEAAPAVAAPVVEAAPQVVAKLDAKPAVKSAAVDTKPAAATKALQPASTTVGLPRVSRDETLPPDLMAMQERAFEGVPEAQHDLAALYAEGRRVRQDYTRARGWFSWAAAAGVANAHYNLAVMDQQGLGGAANMPAALGHYTKAADLGHPEAMYNIGLYYTDKRSNGYNAARGVAYFKRAANAGMTQAAYNLGVIYESEMLGKQDVQSALEWYGVAAGDGNNDAALAVRRLTRVQNQRAAAP